MSVVMNKMSFYTAHDRARYAEKAQSIFANFSALDPQEPHRRELLAAGVSARRVESLYPKHFSALVPGLVRHLGGDIPNALRAPILGQASQVMSEVVQSLPDAVVRKYYSALAAERSTVNPGTPAFPELTRTLQQLWELKVPEVNRLTNALWQAWWLMDHREEDYPQDAGTFVDLLMIEVASYVVRDLVLASEPLLTMV